MRYEQNKHNKMQIQRDACGCERWARHITAMYRPHQAQWAPIDIPMQGVQDVFILWSVFVQPISSEFLSSVLWCCVTGPVVCGVLNSHLQRLRSPSAGLRLLHLWHCRHHNPSKCQEQLAWWYSVTSQNMWMCVCVGFVRCGCVYVWVL